VLYIIFFFEIYVDNSEQDDEVNRNNLDPFMPEISSSQSDESPELNPISGIILLISF
jgi:hypothetical protein